MNEQVISRSYRNSDRLLSRALEVIPLGTQTFSKSYLQYPRGAAPLFLERGKGSRVWDVDGNEYVDFANALASITLGHSDPDVLAAVAEQLQKGTIFALSHPLEIEVAELIVELVPCAQKVRFGKNGSDATSGAVRAARAFTGRDRVAVCGYHGWQDWYIGATTRNKGVPECVRTLTEMFSYNDLASLRRVLDSHPGEFAAVVLEPMNIEFPTEGYLQCVVDMAHEHGALCVFDETITGFRFSPGGAQEFFGVTPDLATFGKGVANGYPLSVVAGRADVMKEFEEIFFSFTMGGETLSLAAAKAVLQKLRRERVTETLNRNGERIAAGVRSRIIRHGCGEFLTLKGHPSWSFLIIGETEFSTSWEIKTLWMQEFLSRGVLTTGTHNVSYAHQDCDIDHLLQAYDEVLPLLRQAVVDGRMSDYLRCRPLEPLFRVR